MQTFPWGQILNSVAIFCLAMTDLSQSQRITELSQRLYVFEQLPAERIVEPKVGRSTPTLPPVPVLDPDAPPPCPEPAGPPNDLP